MSTLDTTGLTLLLGPANSGKLGRVLEWWEQRLPERPVIVTPTGPDALESTAEMVHRAGALVDQAAATTFDGLVNLLVGRSPRYVTDLERDLLLAGLLRETPTVALAGMAHLPGAVTALSALFRRLGDSGREPAEIEHVFRRWAAAEPQSAALSGDISALYGGYRLLCERLGLEDRPAVVREATRVAGSAAWRRPVALYGFTSFTPGQRSLIEELSAHAQVMVSFTYDPSRDLNLCTPAEIAWWRTRAARVEGASTGPRAYDSPAIAYLERYFMSDEPPPEPPPALTEHHGVRFLLGSGQRAEAELAAEHICELLRAGVRPSDVAVVVRRVSAWSRLLSRVFGSCGVPLRVDDRPLLGQTGLGHAFMNALRAVLYDDATALLAFLRGPYSGMPADAVCDLEARYRRGAAKSARALATLAGEAGLPGVAGLWDLAAFTQTGVPGRVRLEAAGALARRMLVAGAGRASPDDGNLQDDARAFNALRGALATLAGLEAAVQARSLSEGWLLVSQAVLAAFGSVPVGSAGAGDSDSVQLMTVQRARARRFPVVAVLGLVEGEFPAGPDRPSLLTPRQTAQLDALAEGLFAPNTENEAALFVSAVSRASRLLLLSARDSEDDGSSACPSYFWAQAKRLLNVAEDEHHTRTLGQHVFSPGSAPTRRHFERSCVAHGLLAAADGGGRSLEARVPAWARVPGQLRSRRVLDRLADMQTFSPSALETYARCPFSWFVERVVRAEDLDVELDGRRLGLLLHTALRETYQRLAASGCLPLRSETQALADQTADGIIGELVEGADCPGTAAERRLAGRRLRRMAHNLFDMEVSSGWSLAPAQLETWVGGREGVDLGGFKVQGRIDRIDEAPHGDGVFVFDYKTGAAPGLSELGTEKGLQLPLYLLALTETLPETRVLGGAYLALSDKKRSGVILPDAEDRVGGPLDGCRVLDETGLDELFERTRRTSREAIAGMRTGVIAPRPDRSCPPWCALGPVCRERRGGYRP